MTMKLLWLWSWLPVLWGAQIAINNNQSTKPYYWHSKTHGVVRPHDLKDYVKKPPIRFALIADYQYPRVGKHEEYIDEKEHDRLNKITNKHFGDLMYDFKPDFIIHNGDMSEYGHEYQLKKFYDNFYYYMKTYLFFTNVGNHDTRNNRADCFDGYYSYFLGSNGCCISAWGLAVNINSFAQKRFYEAAIWLNQSLITITTPQTHDKFHYSGAGDFYVHYPEHNVFMWGLQDSPDDSYSMMWGFNEIARIDPSQDYMRSYNTYGRSINIPVFHNEYDTIPELDNVLYPIIFTAHYHRRSRTVRFPHGNIHYRLGAWFNQEFATLTLQVHQFQLVDLYTFNTTFYEVGKRPITYIDVFCYEKAIFQYCSEEVKEEAMKIVDSSESQ